ncbi:MAG: hypothetical protein AAGK01_11525 [Pseudomonadota bacterium]
MDLFVILVLWGVWGILSAWGWRFLLPRFVFRFESKLLALFLTYASMAAMLGFSVWFLEYSGWQLKGTNEEPLQKAGGFVFFLSPIGWPLIVGGPVVLLADVILYLRRRYWEPIP